MTSRACFVGLLAYVVLLLGAGPAASDPPRSVSSYYLARGDPRLCPSPICGGIWVTLVNKGNTSCGDGVARRECYAASADLRLLRNSEEARARLSSLISEGRALARGKLVRGRIDGFPELDVLVVSEVWTASSSPARPQGVFHRLRDKGVRCVTTPCFSTHAAALNRGRHFDISGVDLTRTGAPVAERLEARLKLFDAGLIASGGVVREGAGRAFVATQLYVRAPGWSASASRLRTSQASRTSSSVVRKLPIASRSA